MMDNIRTDSWIQIVVKMSSRLICVGAIIWFGLIVAAGAGSFQGQSRSEQSSPQETANLPAAPASLMATAGYWSFADSDLSTLRTRCNAKELKNHFDELLTIEGSTETTHRDASHLVGLARSHGAIRRDCKAGSAWTFEHSGLRICLVTTNATMPSLVAAAFAVQDKTEWQLTLLMPDHHQSEHMLPLPAGSRISCARRNQSGQLQMELVSTSQTSGQLLSLWRSRGWSIQKTPWCTENSFSYLCGKDSRFVYVWSDSNFGRRNIMLTSSNPDANIPSLKNQQENQP